MTDLTFSVGDAMYKVRKTDSSIRNDLGGVHIIRCEGSNENCQQALLAVVRDNDTLHLNWVDGDLDVKTAVAADQRKLEGYDYDIWQRIWKVAMD